jgi:hypothetical protein
MTPGKMHKRDAQGWAIRFMTWFSGLPLTEKLGLHGPSLKLVRGIASSGFVAAGAAVRSFKAAQKLAAPQRLGRPSPLDLFDLTPTDEQRMIRESVQRFAAERLRPAASAAEKANAAPADLLKDAAGLGLNLLNIPESLGGAASERSPVSGTLIAEALAHGDMGLAVVCLAPASAAAALAEWGDADQQARYLGSFTGEHPPMAALAVLEETLRFNPFALATSAVKTGDGYVLSGEKVLVPGAAQAELLLVAARMDDGQPALFIVESSAAGLSLRPEPAMGLRAAGLTRLRLDRVKVPLSARLGGEAGMDGVNYGRFINLSRLAWCALACGTAQAVLDHVIPYANERQAFGEPISHRQAVAFMIADMGIELDGMRLATWRAASLAAQGEDCTREAAVARELCARHGMRIGADGVQILGGHGYVKEHPVERWYRDLRSIAVMEGGLML